MVSTARERCGRSAGNVPIIGGLIRAKVRVNMEERQPHESENRIIEPRDYRPTLQSFS